MELSNLQIPKAKINQLKSKGIETVEDLVKTFPRKYLDFRRPVSLYQALDGELVSVIIDIYDITDDGRMLKIRGKDINGKHIFITYFGQLYIGKELQVGDRVIFCGKIQIGYNGLVSMTNPVAYSKNIESLQKIMPIYSKVQGMSDEYFKKTLNIGLSLVDKTEYIPKQIREMFDLMTYSEALNELHNPTSPQLIAKAKDRFLFDDLFLINYSLIRNSLDNKVETDIIYNSTENRDAYIKTLPFTLTEGQSNAINKCHEIIHNKNQLNALVQGDVGCGKTEVAKCLLMETVENRYQGVLLAPTTVLAKQHYEDLIKSFESFNLNIKFLNGDIKTKERREILEGIKDGSVDIVVGTHAVFSKDVEYKNLGLIVVDEEHKFGVSQKDSLREKGKDGVHYISLSATPIPRTLATTLYGDDVDIFTIKNRPNGRLPIKTMVMDSKENIYKSIKFIHDQGEQAYLICPVIETDLDNEEYSAESIYKEAQSNLGYMGIKVGLINGKMKEQEINEILDKFLNKEYDVLVSTTIVEVGVNVPNATFIGIIGAERFGLSQLHQLRGRVGRSSKQSYCALYPSVNLDDKKYEKIKERLNIMCETNDGFRISEEDLKMRGAGELLGESQTGENKYIDEMLQNQELNTKIHDLCKELVKWQKTRNHFDRFLLKKADEETI